MASSNREFQIVRLCLPASLAKRTKPMRSVKLLIAAGAASLMSSAAFAADMPIMPPPPPAYAPPPPCCDTGGWYLRGDVGITSPRATNISNPLDSGLNITGPSYTGTGLSGAGLWDIGAGYQFNNWFRADVTAQWRGKSNFHGSQYTTAFAGSALADNYSRSQSELVF